MSQMITLYRGDSMPRGEHQSGSAAERGRTFANLFCGSGVTAKFVDGGSSDLLENRDLLALVLAHVGWERGTPEEKLMLHSPLISFSECEDFALRFANVERHKLEACDFYEASYFAWRLDVSLENPLEAGRYAFEYEFDAVNVRQLSALAVHRGHQMVMKGAAVSDLARPLGDLISQVSTFGHPRRYHAEIVDVVNFVINQDTSDRDEELVRRTLDRARRDREWLVFPMDPGPQGLGYSACIQMNRNLAVSGCFKLRDG